MSALRLASPAVAGALLLTLAGCGGRPVPAPVPGEDQTGIASYYGREFHGRQTASGEIYNENELTAAHRTLPFGTWVRVTNLENEKSVELRINDRGPFVDGRVIDVSYRAARDLDFVRQGLVRVRVRTLERPMSSG